MTVLACDFGGRRIKLGVIRRGQVAASRVLPAHADQPLARRLPEVSQSLREMCRDLNLPIEECRGVGISYPSIIDPTTGQILDEFGKYGVVRSRDLHDWSDAEFGLPVVIENDARMALIGEWREGAGRGCDNVAIMTLGTGLGAAAVMQGNPVRGRHGQAGILGGHFTVQLGGRTCVCGNQGCAEAEASTSVLDALVQQTPEFGNSQLANESELSYEAIFRCAAAGDSCAQKISDHSLNVWGAMAVNLIHAYDPEILILGGGIMGSEQIVLPAILNWVQKYAHTPWGSVRIVPSQLGDGAALIAAEWLVAEQLRTDR